MKKLLGIIMILPLLGWFGYRIVAVVQFDRTCGGHLKRAGDANTVELAKSELGIVIKYLEDNKMTDGFTSIVYTTTDEDVGFWYKNLKASSGELEKIGPDATPLERSNLLIKLRETLLDHTQSGVKATEPNGISVYPHNTLIFLWFLFATILGIAGAFVLAVGIVGRD